MRNFSYLALAKLYACGDAVPIGKLLRQCGQIVAFG